MIYSSSLAAHACSASLTYQLHHCDIHVSYNNYFMLGLVSKYLTLLSTRYYCALTWSLELYVKNAREKYQVCIACVFVRAMADLGGFLGFHGTPLWAGPSIKKYWWQANWNPRLGKELRNQLLWLTSACLSKDPDRKWRDWQVVQEASLKNARKWAWFSAKVGVAPKFSRALCAQYYYRTPFNKSCIRHWITLISLMVSPKRGTF